MEEMNHHQCPARYDDAGHADDDIDVGILPFLRRRIIDVGGIIITSISILRFTLTTAQASHSRALSHFYLLGPHAKAKTNDTLQLSIDRMRTQR